MTLKDELIDVIKENPRFDMSLWQWSVPGEVGPLPIPTCGTAACIAGHIAALRPKMAAELGWGRWGEESLTNQVVAAKIWEREMGEECQLDFVAIEADGVLIEDITKEAAIAHIEANDGTWPVLP